ncbi:hypothetical protein K9F62_17490 [Desulfovibrio sp. JY]|nr:hypothetical protein K9F62_17490 [Desulfovibrio sp. JY]
MPKASDPLANIPDLRSREEIVSWLQGEDGYRKIREMRFSDAGEAFSVTWDEVHPLPSKGNAASLNRFVLALLLADWACYADAADREDSAHLQTVVATFPKGFRLWMARVRERCVPVGYTGFHPIAKETFSLMRDAPERITSRTQIAPERASTGAHNYFYLFNIGIVKQFHGTNASRALVKVLARDLASTPKRGLAAIVISPDGKRVVERFGLRQSGFITHAGQRELAYVGESDATQNSCRA